MPKNRKFQQKKVFQDFDFLRKKDFGDENQRFSKYFVFSKNFFLGKKFFEKDESQRFFSPERGTMCLFSRKKISSPGENRFRGILFSPGGKKELFCNKKNFFLCFFERKFTLHHPHSCLHSRQMPTWPAPFLPPKLHPQCR